MGLQQLQCARAAVCVSGVILVVLQQLQCAHATVCVSGGSLVVLQCARAAVCVSGVSLVVLQQLQCARAAVCVSGVSLVVLQFVRAHRCVNQNRTYTLNAMGASTLVCCPELNIYIECDGCEHTSVSTCTLNTISASVEMLLTKFPQAYTVHHWVGQNHVIYIYTVYIRIFGREMTKYTVIHGVYARL